MGSRVLSKVLIVYPPNQLMPVELRRFDGSLGPLYLAAALEREGFEADILDASVGTAADTFNHSVMQENGLIRIGMTDAEISEHIARGEYAVVGVSSNFTPQTRTALAVARAAKKVSPEILVVAGGVNARALADRFLAGGADVVCSTEGERVFVNLVRAWERGEALASVSGTITLRDGRLSKHPPQPSDTCTNLDQLPVPAWEKLPLELYDTVTAGRDSLEKTTRSASLETSRGCPFACAYCHNSVDKTEQNGRIGKLRFKSVGRVMREMEFLKSLGVSKLYLEDDSLLANKKVREIFTLAKAMGLMFADVNGVNLPHFLKREGPRYVIDEECLELLAEAGLTQIVFPVESASPRILKKYATSKLNHERLNVVELVRVAVKKGITCPINMMIGFPDETEAEMRSSIELGRRLVDAGAPYCSIYIVIPFPGSRLFEIALEKGYLAEGFDADAFNWRKPVMQNTTVPPALIEELQKWAWKSINPPAYVAKRLSMNMGAARWKSGGPE